MKFFIDTANLAQIKEANELGILDGVTTNPSLVAKSGRDFKYCKPGLSERELYFKYCYRSGYRLYTPMAVFTNWCAWYMD